MIEITGECLLKEYGVGRRDFRHVRVLTELELCGPAIFEGMGLQGIDFTGADLQGVRFWGANLFGAIFAEANLRGADLTGANLHCAVFDGADLRGARYSPLDLLQSAWWGDLSDELTTEMIRWDEACRVFGGPTFQRWSKCEGLCPFGGSEKRAFLFCERRETYKWGKPKMTIPDLFLALCEEKGIKVGPLPPEGDD